jgi:DNA-binding MarR family transcriptional regulator
LSTLHDIETARIRHAAYRQLIEFLADGPEAAISARVLVLQCLLNPHRVRQSDLARQLGISRQAVSKAVDKLRQNLAGLAANS